MWNKTQIWGANIDIVDHMSSLYILCAASILDLESNTVIDLCSYASRIGLEYGWPMLLGNRLDVASRVSLWSVSLQCSFMCEVHCMELVNAYVKKNRNHPCIFPVCASILSECRLVIGINSMLLLQSKRFILMWF